VPATPAEPATTAQATQGPPARLLRAPGAPPRTTVAEPVGSRTSQYFFLHDDNFFAVQTNGGSPPLVKFQLSVRFEVISLGGDRNNFALNFAYTQKSFWALFALDDSSPFVENNYKPEAFLSYRPDRERRYRELQLGYLHESNGLGRLGQVDQSMDSRGWNYFFLEGRWGFARDDQGSLPWFFPTLGLRLWYPFDATPHLVDHEGYFAAFLDLDLSVPSFPRVGRLSTRASVRRHSAQADFYYPLLPFVTGGRIRTWIFAQVFYGQAERLITFDQKVTHIYAGLGFQ
jgi:outer membrane phospholipase A